VSGIKITSHRILHQEILKLPECIVVQIVRPVTPECGQLDENGPHGMIIRK
jgi:hypothetical protein